MSDEPRPEWLSNGVNPHVAQALAELDFVEIAFAPLRASENNILDHCAAGVVAERESRR